MSRHLSVRAAGAVAAGLALVATLLPASTAQAADPWTVTTLHFTVKVGPAGTTPCKVIGDLYLPRTASAKKPVPALLTTNGFGGSKDDEAGLGKRFAKRGYAVLAYSGLGFGGSGCKITLDDREHDGKAASQLVSYLGGRTGIAFLDEKRTRPAPALKVIRRDARDNNGKKSTNDPVVGMIGGSYGGHVQYAAAAVDPRIDTIVPLITWNDLTYALSPNNTSQLRADGVGTAVPGAAKLVWALGFYGLGMTAGVKDAAGDPNRLIGCPNFPTFVCPALVTAAVTGTLDATATKELRQRSVTSFVSKVKVPTLILQGQSDTLFNLNEGVATFQALRRQKTPTKMIWINGGHTGPNAPGELDLNDPDPATQAVTKRISDWFDHHLKGAKKVSTGPLFSYFRDWVGYRGSAAPAYAGSATFPVGTRTAYHLSGRTLTPSRAAVVKGTQSLLTPPAGLPTSTDPVDALSQVVTLPEIDVPGTFGSWTSAPLKAKVDVVGSPTLDLAVQAPTARLSQLVDAGKLVLFAKVLDVGPDGKATLIRDLVAPIRVPDAGTTFRATLPAFVHRFAPGHSIRLVLAGGSANYRGSLTPMPVTIATGGPGQTLTLPVVR